MGPEKAVVRGCHRRAGLGCRTEAGQADTRSHGRVRRAHSRCSEAAPSPPAPPTPLACPPRCRLYRIHVRPVSFNPPYSISGPPRLPAAQTLCLITRRAVLCPSQPLYFHPRPRLCVGCDRVRRHEPRGAALRCQLRRGTHILRHREPGHGHQDQRRGG